MGDELVKTERQSIDLVKDPDRVLNEAKKAADALVRVVNAKPKKVIINGEQYLEFEDWQTLGRFYGLTVKVDSSKPVNFDGVRGWEARAVVLREGQEISAADAMCLNDEEKWSARSKYEYTYVLKDGTKTTEEPPKDQIQWVKNPNKPGKMMPKKERVKSKDEPVPFFQLRSMAQTRAAAKALRNVLAWVVVLAGYKPTPAEEMQAPESDEPIEAEFTEDPKKEEEKESSVTKKTENFPSIMKREQERVGDEKFFEILNSHGFERIEEVTVREKQVAIYKELLSIKE